MQDRKVVLAVIVAVALAANVSLLGLIALAWTSHTVPDGLVPIATGALGVLGGLLANTRTSAEEPAEVQVVNPPADPVPVAEAPKARAKT